MRRSSLAVAHPFQQGLVARYELGRELGVGGMGVILQARDRLAQREVAYKRLRVRSESSRARLTALFQREFDTLARLPHPNIVEVYDYGVDEQGPFYTMELLSGKDLADLAPLPFLEACRVLRDIASALALVHARRLVHRDVSPNNIRLTSDGRAKLIDFGGLTPFGRPKELVGTPAFLAPECLGESELDQRTDLYSLGALAYWVLTRRPAVRAQSLEDLAHAWQEPPPPPSQYASDIPEELDRLVLSLLSEDPLGRPSNAAYLIDRLTAIAELAPESDERSVAFSYLKHPPMVGRDAILQQLDQAVPNPISRRGQSLLIEARAGLGRTSLLDELAMRSQVRGSIVLRGDGGRDGAPFGVARHLVNAGLALFPEVADTLRSRDSVYFASQAEKTRPGRSVVDLAERHARVLWSLQDCLLELSRRNPLVLLVDDIHTIDAESLSLLASLAHETADNALLLAMTSVPKPSGESHVMLRLAAACVRVSLAPLAEAELELLVNATFGGVPNCHRVAQWLKAQSGGNPSQCMDLVRLLLQRGTIRYTLGTFTLPHDLESETTGVEMGEAQLARLADLSSEARTIAHAMSLRDGAFGIDELCAVTELPAHDVLRRLEALTQRGVVVGSDDGFSFASASLRTAVARGLSPEVANGLHVRLARALLALPERSATAELAAGMHLMQGGCEEEGAELVMVVARDDRLEQETAAKWVPPLEAALGVLRKQGRSDEQCLALLVPLVRAGFYGELAVQHRHLARTIAALSKVTGMTLANKARRFLGGKLALFVGLLYAVARRALTSRRWRGPKVKVAIGEFVLTVRTAASAAQSALDTVTTERVLHWLDPLAALPKHSSVSLMREASLALAELAAGNFASAAARYAELIPQLSKPVRGFDDRSREALRLSCINGRAQAAASDGAPAALEMADELERGSQFFAPHAECARMTYYAYRGEQAKAELHRTRAEMAALRGGTSWSAVTILTVRLAYGAALRRDVIGLVRAIAELDRLSAIAPKLRIVKALSEGWLEALRGRPDRAVALYDAVIHSDEARQILTTRMDMLLFVTTLNLAGQHARAKEVCLAIMSDPVMKSPKGKVRSPEPVLALAEAGLGNHAAAAALLDQHIIDSLPSKNPLLLGGAHRDRAQVAIRARDRQAFDEHFAKMTEYFRATESPALIQQCDALLSEAIRGGMRPTRVYQQMPIADELERGETVIEGGSDDDEPEHSSVRSNSR